MSEGTVRAHNLHVRRLNATEDEVGALIDSLSGPDDQLWPSGWPPMRFAGTGRGAGAGVDRALSALG